MTRKTPKDDPSLEEIGALLSGELKGTRAEAIRDALAEDAELARAALDLANPSNLSVVANLGADELDNAWALFKSRVENTAELPLPTMESNEATSWFGRFARNNSSWGMAASFLVGFCIAGLLFHWWQTLVLPSGVIGRVEVERLERVGDAGPTRGGEAKLNVDNDTKTLILLLSPPSTLYGEIPSRVHCKVSRGTDLVISGELSEQDEGFFALSLPLDSLSSGEFWIRLFRPEEKEPFAEYYFVLTEKGH